MTEALSERGAGAAASSRRRGRRRRSGRPGLRLVRSTSDRLSVAWPATAGVSRWQVVCWDGNERPVASLTLAGKHHLATVGGLTVLEPPFTIAVSGLDNHSRVLWQDGLADLRLRTTPARPGAANKGRRRR